MTERLEHFVIQGMDYASDFLHLVCLVILCVIFFPSWLIGRSIKRARKALEKLPPARRLQI